MNDGKIILVNEDDSGYGYVVSENERTSLVYIMYWARDNETKSVFFLNINRLLEHCLAYVQSDLVRKSPLHEAKYKMCKDFIQLQSQKCGARS